MVKKQIATRLPIEEYKLITKICEEQGISFSDFFREAVSEKLDKILSILRNKN